MKKTTYLFLVFLIVSLSLIVSQSNSRSQGAPSGRTGAPGESTCASSSCHNGNSAINNSVALEITFSGIAHEYTPNAIYEISVANKVNSPLYGFSATILDASSNGIGTLSISDVIRTKFGSSIGSKQYITHTKSGTSPVGGAGDWKFTWQAPPPGSGEVTIYAASLSSNNNRSRSGDVTHLKTLSLVEATSAGLNDFFSSPVKVSSNSRSSEILLEWEQNESNLTSLEILDMRGSRIQYNEFNSSVGRNSETVSLNPMISSGLYIIMMRSGNELFSKKIYLN